MNDKASCVILNENCQIIDSSLPNFFKPDVSSGSVLLEHICESTDRERLRKFCSSGGNPVVLRLKLGDFRLGVAVSNRISGKSVCEVWLFEGIENLISFADTADLLHSKQIRKLYSEYTDDIIGFLMSSGTRSLIHYSDSTVECRPFSLIESLSAALTSSPKMFSSVFSFGGSREDICTASVEGIPFAALFVLTASVLDRASTNGIINVTVNTFSESYNVTLSTGFSSRAAGFTFDVTYLSEFIPMSYLRLSALMYIAAENSMTVCAEINGNELLITFGKIRNTSTGSEFKYTENELFRKIITDAAVKLLSVKYLQEG